MTAGGLLRRERDLFALLRRELAPSPRRWQATLRLTLACVVAIALLMSLHVPEGEFLLVTLFIVSQSDAWASLAKAALRLAGTIAGGLLAIVAIAAFADAPWLLFPLQGLVVAAMLFLSRTTMAPYAFLMVGVTFLIVAPDYITMPALNVDRALWRVGLTALGALLGTGIQTLLWRIHPEAALLDDLAARLARVDRALARAAEGGGAEFAGDPVAAVGMAGQLDLLGSAESMTPWLRQRHPEQMKLIVEVQRLVSAAIRIERARLAASDLPAPLRAELESARLRIAAVRAALEARRPAADTPPVDSIDFVPLDAAAVEVRAGLEEIDEALTRIPATLGFLAAPHLLSPEPWREPLAWRGLLRPDCSLANTEAVRYALKGALGASVCALAYTAMHWHQISTCVMTCLVVAQSTVGAGRRKSHLRLLGASAGGLAAMAVILVLIPNMTSLASLLVVCALVYGAAAWVLAGSSRISYAGMQMGLALSLVLNQSVMPSVDLDPARDRLFGILFGVIVMGAIDIGLWPVFARDALREKLAAALEQMAALQRLAAAGDDVARRSRAVAIYRLLADSLALADEALAEPEWREDQAARRRTTLRATGAVQDLFLAQLAVGRHRNAATAAGVPERVAAALAALDGDVAGQLLEHAAALRGDAGAAGGHPPDAAAVEALAAVSQAPAVQEAATVYRDLLAVLPQLRVLSNVAIEPATPARRRASPAGSVA